MTEPKIYVQLKGAFIGRSPLVYVFSPEEERVMRTLTRLAEEYGKPLRAWSCVRGLDGCGEETCDAVAALKEILNKEEDCVYVFKDLPSFFSDQRVVRALREVYNDLQGHEMRTVFIISPELTIPESLKKEMHTLEISTPDDGEIAELLKSIVAANPDYSIPEEAIREVTLALKGLTENEISYVMHRACRIPNATKDQLLDEIFAEKKSVVKKSGFLEFSPPRWDINSLGGLGNLKDWLLKRSHMFTKEALEAGVPIPKGLLMMGVSGCGKSLAVKTISALWNIPMFRLDMNLVFSGMYGSPEEAFHRALTTIEAVAPAVLWIDEIENALGLDDSGQRIASHIFSSFLTWMQEKPPLIFIAATANKIQALPAEVLRKGRFDEVFFCDLPSAPEREEILKIHLKRNGANIEEFDFKMLQIMSEGWNGAEIEQAVIAARTEAFYENRQFTQRDLTNVMSRIVPLSDTMEQQIKAIRSWAFSRATPASKYGKSAAKAK
ncbi:MAG: AAA family ATPase [Victivallales bacterium]|nr:AAA family ATPase [Victivallales bacterium]